MPRGAKVDKNKWVPIADIVTHKTDKSVSTEPVVKNRGTQTLGIFYQSANTITGKKHIEAWKKTIKAATRDRVVDLTTFSAGKGQRRSFPAAIAENVVFQGLLLSQECGGCSWTTSAPTFVLTPQAQASFKKKLAIKS